MTRQNNHQEINVMIYKNDGGKVPDTIETLNIRAGLFHVKSAPSVQIPEHLSYEMERRLPVLCWGRKAAIERMVTKMKDTFPQKLTTVVMLFVRPYKAILGSRHKFEEQRAVITAAHPFQPRAGKKLTEADLERMRRQTERELQEEAAMMQG